MPVRQKDAQRALELLQQYRSQLDQRAHGSDQTDPGEQDLLLGQSLDRVISVFQSRLFNALLDIQEYYELTLQADSHLSVDQPNGQGEVEAVCGPPSEQSNQTDPSSSGPLGVHPPSAAPGPPGSAGTKSNSVKSPGPPVPSRSPGDRSPRPQSAQVKNHAPPPPVQPRAAKSEEADGTLKVLANGVHRSSNHSSDGPAPRTLPATDLSPADPSASSPGAPGSPPGSPSLCLGTVSALVSGTLRGLVSPASPDTALSPGLPGSRPPPGGTVVSSQPRPNTLPAALTGPGAGLSVTDPAGPGPAGPRRGRPASSGPGLTGTQGSVPSAARG
ncbi:hypothetical protein NHX12_033933, partial [Muraenolepis orangiensis]